MENVSQANEVILAAVDSLTPQYETMMTLLTSNQVNLMKAIAKEGKVDKPQSADFIKKYNLASASSVKTALTALIDKELVYLDKDGYIIYDRFLNLWLRRLL